MASKVEICNFALQNLGANSITSLNEDSTEAIECNLRFDSSRRALLQMHLWNFAIKRASLNRETSTPAFNYNYQFTLPSDFLYAIMTGLEENFQSPAPQIVNTNLYVNDVPSYGGIDKYRIENGKLLSYEQDVNLIYVADVTDTAKFSATFTELLARYLTYQIAYRVVGSRTERDSQKKIFEQELEEFKSIDSQQGVFDRLEVSQFLSERF